MWRRLQPQSRAAAMSLNPSAGPPYGGQFTGSKTVVADDKVVFMALGTFFGLIFLLFGIQIYVRCIWKRLQTSVNEMEDEPDEVATRGEVYIREVREVGRRRNWRRRLHHYFDERSESSSPTQHVPVGLEKSVLDLLPTFVFNTDVAFRDEMVCAVCLEEFKEGEQGRLLPKCSHCFHVQCIDMWFLSHSSCPLCRSAVSAPSQECMSDPLLQTSRSCPDFSQVSLDRSEQQQQEQGAASSGSPASGFRDRPLPEESRTVPSSPRSAIVSHTSTSVIVIPGSASIAEAVHSNDALYLERGSSLSGRAADIALEISSDESVSSETEEDQQLTRPQPAEMELVIMRGSSLDIPSLGSQHRNSSGSNPFLEYQAELHPSATTQQTHPALSDEDATTAASCTSRGSSQHSRKRSFSAVEIIGEYELDTSGATSLGDTSPVLQGCLQAT